MIRAVVERSQDERNGKARPRFQSGSEVIMSVQAARVHVQALVALHNTCTFSDGSSL